MQSDIISKVWLYKDKLGHVQGPFMSYDMDIWNDEPNYFAEDVKVALMNSPFLPLQIYLDRAQVVIDIVQNFILKNEQANKEPFKNPSDNAKKGNNKKYSFHKKSETEKEVVMPANFKSPAELTTNFSENFPPLAEGMNKRKTSTTIPVNATPLASTGKSNLLDTLRGTVAPQGNSASLKADAKAPEQNAQKISPLPTDQKQTNPNDGNKKETGSSTVAKKQISVEVVDEVKKVNDPILVQKTSQTLNSKKNSTKKNSKRGKADPKDSYPDLQSTIQYVEKVEVEGKAGPATQTSHNDLTLSIKNMLGLNLK
jgi:hypothetical protein